MNSVSCQLSVVSCFTAKRLRLEAQGCFNPGLAKLRLFNPERVAPVDATALRLRNPKSLPPRVAEAATLGFGT